MLYPYNLPSTLMAIHLKFQVLTAAYKALNSQGQKLPPLLFLPCQFSAATLLVVVLRGDLRKEGIFITGFLLPYGYHSGNLSGSKPACIKNAYLSRIPLLQTQECLANTTDVLFAISFNSKLKFAGLTLK